MAVFKIIAFDVLVIRHCQVHCMSMVIEKKMFEYYGNIHVCCPGVGTDVPLVSVYFRYHWYKSYCPFPARFSL